MPKKDPNEDNQSQEQAEDYSPGVLIRFIPQLSACVVTEETDWDFFQDVVPWTAPEVSPDQDGDQMFLVLIGLNHHISNKSSK